MNGTSIAMSSYSLYFQQKRTNKLNMTPYVNVCHVRAQGELRYHLIEVLWLDPYPGFKIWSDQDPA